MATIPGSFLTNPLFQVISFGAGTAMGPAIRPLVQDIANETWTLNPVRPVDAATLAAGVAQGQVPYDYALAGAQATGYGKTQFDHMVDIANVGPGAAYAFEMWRRGQIGEAGFRRAVKRLGLEAEWIDDLVALHDLRLSPSEIANAVQQGHILNNGVLPSISPAVAPGFTTYPAVAPDAQPPSSVPLTQIDIDPLEEIKQSGIDTDRLRVIANLAGLPPGPEALLTMWNRALIDEASVDAGIREGHMKTKWTGPFKRMRWAVLSGQDYAELQLRDWITPEQMYHGGALTGHTPEQMDLLFKNRGRTATPRQVWLAAARKKVGPRGVVTTQLDHEQAIRRSNIRPEYSDMLWEIRFNYPPLFQLGRLVTAGAITPATAAEWATWQLYGPEVITALTKYWESVYPGAAGDTQTVDKARVKSAVTSAINEVRDAYILRQADESQSRGWLDRLGMNGPTQDALFPVWDVLREIPQKGLTAAQIVKAFKNLPALWPRARALDELQLLGLTADDAATLLDE